MKPIKRPLRSRVLIFSLTIAIGPLALVAWRTISNASNVKEDIIGSFEKHAVNGIDVLERNLFERYGDVQAFAANEVVLNSNQWGKKTEGENGIIRAMNAYMNLYDIYSIMIAVDLEGNPIAVNTLDANGKPTDNDWVYEQNFEQTEWFKKAIRGEFLVGSGTTGTVVEDVHPDSLVQRAIGGDGLAISYSAPIKDNQQKTIGVWTNRVSISLLTSILEDTYRSFEAIGYKTTEITLIDKVGRIIVDLDPFSHGGENRANQDPSQILNLNLATDNVEAARAAVRGESGAATSKHARKGITQLAGYAHSQGALGYKGLDWSLLVRVDDKESMRAFNALNRELTIIVTLSVLITVFLAWGLARNITAPLIRLSDLLANNAVATRHSAQSLSQSADALANGSTEQAANVEETSASTEQLNAMTSQNQQSVAKALEEVHAANSIVDLAGSKLNALSDAMDEISAASGETKNIIKTIDEIAFQTNILALNAAVEAARAGEAGAGFAIVADEVRNLAARAAQAAQNTSGLLDQNIAKIASGTRSLAETNEGFKELIETTRRVSSYIDNITEATGQQSIGLNEINSAVNQISSVTQENAAGSEQVAAAARELDAQASEISKSVEQLQILILGRSELSEKNQTRETFVPARKSNRIREQDLAFFN